MLIDELMPRYDMAARYETLVRADPALTFYLLQHVDFSRSGIIRVLMGLRTLGRSRKPKRDPGQSQCLTERMRGSGFVLLRKLEDQEILIGVVGRFWQPRSAAPLGMTNENCYVLAEC